MTRDELVNVMRAHCKRLGVRDRLAHCSCGWASDPIKVIAPWGQHQHHLAEVILALVESDSYDERPIDEPRWTVRADASGVDWRDE
jgi:hypothetical protein